MHPKGDHMSEQTSGRRLARVVAPVAAAVAVGAGAGAGAYAYFDDGGAAPAATAAPAAQLAVATQSPTPTIAQIYQDAAAGVVELTVTGHATTETPDFGPNWGPAQRPQTQAS